MTPGARVAAAIEVLADVEDGQAAEQALTRWARRSRFAGSKDRAAVRDHVFDVIRRRRSAAHFGGGDTPRALMIGALRSQGVDIDTLFSGEGHSPLPLSHDETSFVPGVLPASVSADLPDWLMPLFERSVGPSFRDTAARLRERAPVTLRINQAITDRAKVAQELQNAGIETRENSLCETALTVTSGARGLRGTVAYNEGRIELQDAASQAVVAALPKGQRVLDFCAGGGGKSLAIAAQPSRTVTAYDANPRRMVDLAERAKRAGAINIQIARELSEISKEFDIVLCDAPCSGSGAWRRAPEGKWLLSPGMLDDLCSTQDAILNEAQGRVAAGGTLVYATCSVLAAENEERIDAFLERHSAWDGRFQRRFDVTADGDGFFTAHLSRV